MGKISDYTPETNPAASDDLLIESYATGATKKIARNYLLSSKNLTSLPDILDGNDTIAVSDDSDSGKAKKMSLEKFGSHIASDTFSAVNGSYFDLVGDGVTNNYDAFVEAIDYCITNSLDLILTAGVYYVDPGSGITLDFTDVTVVFKRGAKIKLLRADNGVVKLTEVKAGKYQIFDIDYFNDSLNPLYLALSPNEAAIPEWFGAVSIVDDSSIDQAKINSDAIIKAHLSTGKVFYSASYRCYYPIAWRPTTVLGMSSRSEHIYIDGETERTTQITVTATTGTDFVLGMWRATRTEDTLYDEEEEEYLTDLSDPRIFATAGLATATLTAAAFITAHKATIESLFDGVTITSVGTVITIVESTMNRVDWVQGGSVSSDVYDMPGFETQTYYFVKNYDMPIHSRWGFDIRLNYNDGGGAPTTKTTGAALTNGDVYTNLSGTVYVRVGSNWKVGAKRENFMLANHPTKPRLNVNDMQIKVENVYAPTSYMCKLEFQETHSIDRFTIGGNNCDIGGYWVSEYGMGPANADVFNLGFPAGNLRCNDYVIDLNADRALRLTSFNYRCGYPRKGWRFIGPVILDGALIEHSPDPRVDYVFLASAITTAPSNGDVYSNNGSEFTVFGVGGKYIFTTRTSGTAEPLASGDLTRVSGAGDNPIAFASVSTGFRTYLAPKDGNCLFSFFPDASGNPVVRNAKLTMSLANTDIFYVSMMSDKNGRNDFLAENVELVVHTSDDVPGNVGKLLTIGHYSTLDDSGTTVVIKNFDKDYFFNTGATSTIRRGLIINRLTLKDIEIGNENGINSGQSSFISESIADGTTNFQIKLPVIHRPLNQTGKANSGSYLIMISARRQSSTGNTRAGGALFFVTVGKSTSADYDVEIVCLSNTYDNLTVEGTPLWGLDALSTGLESEQVLKAFFNTSANLPDGNVTNIAYSVWALQANTRGNT